MVLNYFQMLQNFRGWNWKNNFETAGQLCFELINAERASLLPVQLDTETDRRFNYSFASIPKIKFVFYPLVLPKFFSKPFANRLIIPFQTCIRQNNTTDQDH